MPAGCLGRAGGWPRMRNASASGCTSPTAGAAQPRPRTDTCDEPKRCQGQFPPRQMVPGTISRGHPGFDACAAWARHAVATRDRGGDRQRGPVRSRGTWIGAAGGANTRTVPGVAANPKWCQGQFLAVIPASTRVLPGHGTLLPHEIVAATGNAVPSGHAEPGLAQVAGRIPGRFPAPPRRRFAGSGCRAAAGDGFGQWNRDLAEGRDPAGAAQAAWRPAAEEEGHDRCLDLGCLLCFFP